MRIAPAIKLTPDQQSLLESQARSRSLPARLVERSHIVLLAAGGKQDKEIAHTLRMTPQKVWFVPRTTPPSRMAQVSPSPGSDYPAASRVTPDLR